MEQLLLALAVVVSLAPVAFLFMAIRHFVPLWRGFSGTVWHQALGPAVFASDRLFSEEARPHRKPFLLWLSLFVAWLVVAFAVFA